MIRSKIKATYHGDLFSLFRSWLPAVDTLRNLFAAPTIDLKITFDLLRQGLLAG